jgi:hypothetical protein
VNIAGSRDLYLIVEPLLKHNPKVEGDAELTLCDELTYGCAAFLVTPYQSKETCAFLLNESELRLLADHCIEMMKKITKEKYELN